MGVRPRRRQRTKDNQARPIANEHSEPEALARPEATDEVKKFAKNLPCVTQLTLLPPLKQYLRSHERSGWGVQTVSNNNMIRWIEAAEERRFYETALADRRFGVTENQYMHFGEAIAKLPALVHRGVSRGTLAVIGCHALEFVRYPLGHTRH